MSEQYTPQPTPAPVAGNQTVSVGDWFLTMIVLSLPVIGFIMMFVWGFGKNTKPSKANYCKLALILFIIFTILGIISAIVMAIAGASIFSSISDGMGGNFNDITDLLNSF